jgi:hypothetical protein
LIARGTQDAEVLLVASSISPPERRKPSLSNQKRAIPAMGYSTGSISKNRRKPQKNQPTNP